MSRCLGLFIALINCALQPHLLHGLSTPQPSSSSSSRRTQRVIVVGAGVGGLATAARIKSTSPTNTDVIILEKNSREKVGGRCGSFDVTIDNDDDDNNNSNNNKGGGCMTFRHERGPSLLLLKHEYEQLFHDCGKRKVTSMTTTAAQEYGLQIKQCIPAYQVVFDDGETISVGFPRSKCNNNDLSLEQIKRIQILEKESISKINNLEPNGFEKWSKYLDTCAAFLDCGLPNFIEERVDVSTLPAFMIEALKENAIRWPLQPHSSMLDNLFESPKLKTMASFQDLYVGLEPYFNEKQRLLGGGVLRKTAPAVFGLLAALELHPTNDKAGVFAPVGGFRQVAESMYQLCLDNDVQLKFDTSVTRITDDGVYFATNEEPDDDNDKKGEFLPADLIICNADVPFATESILSSTEAEQKEDGRAYDAVYDWDDKFDYSSGVIAFHWSLSRRIDALNTHNVFMSAKDSESAISSWSVLRDDDAADSTVKKKSLKGQPFNFYVHRASATDDTAAPQGCDSIMVLVPCKGLVRDAELASLPRNEAISKYKQQFDEEFINDVREAVFDRLSVLNGMEPIIQGDLLDEVIDTPGTYADFPMSDLEFLLD